MTAPLGETNQYHAVWGSAPNDIWLGGSVLLHYDGTSWSPTKLTNAVVNAISGTGPQDVWAVGLGDGTGSTTGHVAGVMHWNGTSWSTTPSPLKEAQLNGVWASSPSNVWAVGYEEIKIEHPTGKVLHFDGASWTVNHDDTQVTELNAVWGSGPSDIYAVGLGGALHYDGSTWSLLSVGSTQSKFNGVAGSSAKDVWISGLDVGDGGAGEIYHFDGASWTKAYGNKNARFGGVWSGGPTRVLVAGTRYDRPAQAPFILFGDGVGWVENVPPNELSTEYTGVWGTADEMWGIGPLSVFRYR